MKLLFITEKYAGETMVRVEWGKEGLFFAGDAPEPSTLIAIELPELASATAAAVRTWLVKHHARGKKSRREDTALTPELWRRAVLDDFLDAANATSVIYYVGACFPLADIAAFAAKYGPSLHGKLRAALDVPQAKRPRALGAVKPRLERIVPVIAASQTRLTMEINAAEVELDRADVARLTAKPFAYAAWIEAAEALRSVAVKHELVTEIGKRLAEADVAPALDLMVVAGLDKIHTPGLWEALGDRLVLPPNTTGATIDLTKAREATVAMTWEVWKARRIGPVKIGRSALVLYDGKRLTYVRGERKLKHTIKRRGGSIHRWGNTLAIDAKDPSSVHAALLRVDEIDTLAQVAPARAVALVPEPIPGGHPIAAALDRAASDPRWRRILADLLIERLVGIDADVARRLARAEARSNRR